MGRRSYKNLNLPPRMRARVKSSGKTFYYYDTGNRPRREIPLGSDYALAIKKWAELEIDAKPRHSEIITFRYITERYLREVVPSKSQATQRDNLREITQLYKFFDNPLLPWKESSQCIFASISTGEKTLRSARRLFSVIYGTRRASGVTPTSPILVRASRDTRKAGATSTSKTMSTKRYAMERSRRSAARCS